MTASSPVRCWNTSPATPPAGRPCPNWPASRTGGTLALSAYKHSLFTRAFAEKEGQHDGGIPFFRFTRRELRALLATAFEVQSVTGVLVYIYLARCRKTT